MGIICPPGFDRVNWTDLKMLSVAVDCIPDAFIVFKHLQTGPSMTFKVYDDHSKMVYDDHSSTEKWSSVSDLFMYL